MAELRLIVHDENNNRWNKTDLKEAIWSNTKLLFEKLKQSGEFSSLSVKAKNNSQVFGIFSYNEPTAELLQTHLKRTLHSQQQSAAKETKFSALLRMRITLVKRILISLESPKASATKKKKSNLTKKKEKSTSSPLIDLSVRTGIRLLLVMLKECWELDDGIDADICREFLQNLSEILGSLPRLSLYESKMSSLGNTTLSSIEKFLKDAACSQQVNQSDRISSLALLSSFCAQRGGLSGVLSLVSYLLTFTSEKILPTGTIHPLLEHMEQHRLRFLSERAKSETDTNHHDMFMGFIERIEQNANKGLATPKELSFLILHRLCRLSALYVSQDEDVLPDQPCEVFIWGCTSNGKLGSEGLDDSGKIASPALSGAFSGMNPKQMVLGSSMTTIVDEEGRVFSCGKGEYGRLGTNSTSETSRPSPVNFDSTVIVQIYLSTNSYGHGIAIDENKGVWSWGDGDYGKLGHDDTEQCRTPKRIQYFKDKKVVKASCGPKHSAVITEEGKLFTFGANESGRLGLGSSVLSDSCSTPNLVESLCNHVISEIACGDIHCIATSVDSQLTWSWGDGTNGRLGLGTGVGQTSTPEIIDELRNVSVVQLGAGGGYSAALTTSGKVFVWGENVDPNGDGQWTPKEFKGEISKHFISQIAAGREHMLLLSKDSEVFSWGMNHLCQCGVTKVSQIYEPKLLVELSGRGIKQISAGSAHSVALNRAPNMTELPPVDSAPYSVELTQETFQHLQKFLASHYPTSPVLSDGDEYELFICSCIRVLRTNLYHVYTTQIEPESVGLAHDGAILSYFRETLLEILQSPNSSAVLQNEARSAFHAGWAILLPSVQDRCELLLKLLPSSDRKELFGDAQRFLVDLLVSTLTKDSEMASILGLAFSGDDSDYKQIENLFQVLIEICATDAISQLGNGEKEISERSSNGSASLLCYIQKYAIAQVLAFTNKKLKRKEMNEQSEKNFTKFQPILRDYIAQLVSSIENVVKHTIRVYQKEKPHCQEIIENLPIFSVFSQFLHAAFNIPDSLAIHFEALISVLSQLDELCSMLPAAQRNEFEELQYSDDEEEDSVSAECKLMDITRTLGMFLGYCCNRHILGRTPTAEEIKLNPWLDNLLVSGGLAPRGYRTAHADFIKDLTKGKGTPLTNQLMKRMASYARNKLWLVGKDDEDETLIETLAHILACLLKHHGCISVGKMFASSSAEREPPSKLASLFQGVYNARDRIIELVKQQSEDIMEFGSICEPILSSCKFLLYDITAATPGEEISDNAVSEEDIGNVGKTAVGDAIEFPRYDLRTSAGDLMIPDSPTVSKEETEPSLAKTSVSIRRASSYYSGQQTIAENEDLAAVVSTMRRFSWLKKEHQLSRTVHSLRESIIQFVLGSVKLRNLKIAMTLQQQRGESRVRGLQETLHLLSSRNYIDSIRYQILVGSFNLWLPAVGAFHYLDNIPAALSETQSQVLSNIHKLYQYLVGLMEESTTQLIAHQNDEISPEHHHHYKWYLHCILQALASPFHSADVTTLVNSGIISILRKILHPAHEPIFKQLVTPSMFLLQSLLATIGADASQVGTGALRDVEKFLRELLTLYRDNEKPEIAELLCVLRRICVSQRIIELFSSPSWTELVLSIVNSGTLKDRIMALRFLEVILLSWKFEKNRSRIHQTLQEFLRILAVNISLPQIRETVFSVTANYTAVFDKSYSKSVNIEDDGLSFTQTEAARINTPGYAFGMVPIIEGVHRWEFQILHDAVDDETLCIGVGTKPLRETSFETSSDLWLLRGYNGKLYHTSELRKDYEGFSIQDKIAIEVDMTAGTVTYFKNGRSLGVAFEGITGTVFPVILFYGGSTRARVSIVESGCSIPSKTVTELKSLVDSLAAPPHAAFCEELVYLLRRLHGSGWGRLINQFVLTQCRTFPDSYSKFYAPDIHAMYVPPLTKSTQQGDLFAALVLLGGVENGFRHGGRVLHATYGVGCALAFNVVSHSVLVHYEPSRVKIEYAKFLRALPTEPFQSSKLILSRNEIHSLASVVAKISTEAITLQQTQIQLFTLKAIDVLISEKENLAAMLQNPPQSSSSPRVSFLNKLLELAVLPSALKPLMELEDLERIVTLLYKDVSTKIAAHGNEADLKDPKRAFIVALFPEDADGDSNDTDPSIITKLSEWFLAPVDTSTVQVESWKPSEEGNITPEQQKMQDTAVDISSLVIKSSSGDVMSEKKTETMNSSKFREMAQFLIQTMKSQRHKEYLLYELARTLQTQYARNAIVKIFSRKPVNSREEPLVDFSDENEETMIQLACLVRIVASGRAGAACQDKLIDMVGYLLDCHPALAKLLMEQCINGFLCSAAKEAKAESGKANHSDLESISSPSFELSQALLPSLIKQDSLKVNDIWKQRLVDSLAACVLSVHLTSQQRSWATLHLSSICLQLFSADGEGIVEWSKEAKYISKLIPILSDLIHQQFRIESSNSGEKIFFSVYLQSLATIYYLFPHEESQSKEIRSYCLATSVVRSLAAREPFCEEFTADIRSLAEQSGEDVESLGYEDNQKRWNLPMDQELSTWRTEQPSDWKRPVSVIGFGCNSYGQLTHEEDEETILEPISTPVMSQLAPQMVCGGNACTFVVTQEGLVYASGKGDYMRLGLGSSDNSTSLKLLRSLQAIRIEKVAASIGSYGHALAIDSQGQLWSWGDGDHGKLGHGNTEQQKYPKIVSTMKRKEVVEISCGYTFSMCVTKKGKLYSWGERPYLGHNAPEDYTVPTHLPLESEIGSIACGQGHSIIVSRDGCTVWTFGDGSNGRLGLGSDESHSTPRKMQVLQDVGITQVEIGSDFSIARTNSGKLYSWGCGAFGTLGHGDCNDRLVPTTIYALEDYCTIDVSCGASHVIAITNSSAGEDETEVFGWGQNEQGKLGLGDCAASLTPKRIAVLSGKSVQQACTGSNHTILWTMKKKYSKPYYPIRIPTKFGRLHHKKPAELYFRAHLLQKFSQLVYKALPFFNIRPNQDRHLSHGLDTLRALLHTPGKISLLRSWVAHTNIDRDVGPTIILNRYSARKGEPGETLFAQAAKQLPHPDVRSLRASKRAWKVQFAGEGADDVGGPYNESVSEMCLELQSPKSPDALFKLSPNGRNREGDNQDRYILRPAKSQSALKLYRFFGVFMGVSIRTKNPLRLFLAPIFWKRLLRIPVTLEDLASVDQAFVTTFRYLMDIDQYGIVDEESFNLLPLEPFKPLNIAPNVELPLTFHNRKEYVQRAIDLHLDKACLEEFQAIREGMEQMLPLSLFSLFTPQEIENLVCGAPVIDWEVLKVNTMYKGSYTESSKQSKWLWEILDSMNAEDRANFLRFVWGHTRLPADPADIKQQFIVQSSNCSPPDQYLPSAQTCFFKVVLPVYSSKEVLREKLTYAIRFCKTIDTDDYARHEVADAF